ncbi:hypothetical protein ATE47_12140 [Chryseobacterium sp. IHB B 17019]|uniref:hypothetical protein n=1 Tax=Chryseobacterium sp. IHB B 17019 TaxID=1721091 RepID=UPI00071ECB38|nr:hypothetical protein [Chryseobacterium sp. IHB B 17019]ALR31225.1 hypothetical protein ATE47_12140 [Chryseobacterium sp. IHB B 17019]
MNVLLSSIAKNDIRLLIRVFNAEKESMGAYFLEDLKESVNEILEQTERPEEISIYEMSNFPVNIYYIFENETTLFVTAVFKN